MMKVKYTNEKNVLMLISILKHNKIKRVVASPGTTNMAFVASIQNDSDFEVYSCVDERSACYMACGLATETNEPVVLTCTGATASRNYLPGLTEAYYRKIPVLAVTCAQHFSRVGMNVPQALDRTAVLKDIVNISVQIPSINSSSDELGCNILLNKAILELKRNGGGPVHINLVTTNEGNLMFDTEVLPDTRMMNRYEYHDEFPNIPFNKIAIFVGAHKKWSKELTNAVDTFCMKYNAAVICDHTSNYHGKFKIMGNILFDQDKYNTVLNNFDLLIHIGDISGSYMHLNAKKIWRVHPDGEIRDTFTKLENVFSIQEVDFFKKYNEKKKDNSSMSYYKELKNELDSIEQKAKNMSLPFSNLAVARSVIHKIPNHSTLHLAILNSLRSMNYFYNEKELDIYANTGGFGIDGPLSTLIGASFANPTKNYFLIVGDLAFFYDMNSLGNRFIHNNIRILLINNGCGTEFHNYSHPASKLGNMTGEYIAADGHFGNKSNTLVKNYVENLGFEYMSAMNEEEFEKQIDRFTSEKMLSKPIVFEVFTDAEKESEALRMIRTIKSDLKGTAKEKIKSILNESTKNKIKKILKK